MKGEITFINYEEKGIRVVLEDKTVLLIGFNVEPKALMDMFQIGQIIDIRTNNKDLTVIPCSCSIGGVTNGE